MALVSLLTERTVRSDTAMTGEISLRGLVLPVGGIKEKVVAAHRARIKRVLLPARNKKDYDDIPEEARQQLEVIWVERVDEVVSAALEPGMAEEPAPSEHDVRQAVPEAAASNPAPPGLRMAAGVAAGAAPGHRLVQQQDGNETDRHNG
jgi:predicted ATP-dependent protease